MADPRALEMLRHLQAYMSRVDVVSELGIGINRRVLLDATALVNSVYDESCQDTPRHTIWRAQQLVQLLATQTQANVIIVHLPELANLNSDQHPGLQLARSLFLRFCTVIH